MRVYVGPLRRRPYFRRLWAAELVSLLGDWLSYVAITVLLAEQGGGTGAFAVAGVLVAHTLPQVLPSPFAGVLADRMDRKRLLVLAHVARCVLTLAMAAAAAVGGVVALPLLVAARTAVVALDVPARAAVLRRTVADDELLPANALADGVLRAAWRDVQQGAALAARRADVTRAVFAKTPFAVAGGGALVTLALVATDVPFAGPAGLTYGLLQMVRGVGTGVRPLVADALVRRGVSPGAAWHGVAAVGFAGIAAFGLGAYPVVWLVAAGVWGFGTGGNWVLASAALQRAAPGAAGTVGSG